MRQSLEIACEENKKISGDLLEIIRKERDPNMLCSIVRLWKDKTIASQKLSNFVDDFNLAINELELILKKLQRVKKQ